MPISGQWCDALVRLESFPTLREGRSDLQRARHKYVIRERDQTPSLCMLVTSMYLSLYVKGILIAQWSGCGEVWEIFFNSNLSLRCFSRVCRKTCNKYRMSRITNVKSALCMKVRYCFRDVACPLLCLVADGFSFTLGPDNSSRDVRTWGDVWMRTSDYFVLLQPFLWDGTKDAQWSHRWLRVENIVNHTLEVEGIVSVRYDGSVEDRRELEKRKVGS